jgi:hypothetical protein
MGIRGSTADFVGGGLVLVLVMVLAGGGLRRISRLTTSRTDSPLLSESMSFIGSFVLRPAVSSSGGGGGGNRLGGSFVVNTCTCSRCCNGGGGGRSLTGSGLDKGGGGGIFRSPIKGGGGGRSIASTTTARAHIARATLRNPNCFPVFMAVIHLFPVALRVASISL